MPILRPNTFEFFTHSPDQTRRLGMRLGALLKPGMVVGLIGDLGAGKTTLVQGIAAGWGALDPVTSPTFILLNVYRRPDGQNLYHLDAYRLQSPNEAWDLDLPSAWDSGPLVVEWADRIADVLPPDRLDIRLTWLDDWKRHLLFEARGPESLRLLRRFHKSTVGT